MGEVTAVYYALVLQRGPNFLSFYDRSRVQRPPNGRTYDGLLASNSLAQVAAHRLNVASNQKLFETRDVLTRSLSWVPLVSRAVRWSTTRDRAWRDAPT